MTVVTFTCKIAQRLHQQAFSARFSLCGAAPLSQQPAMAVDLPLAGSAFDGTQLLGYGQVARPNLNSRSLSEDECHSRTRLRPHLIDACHGTQPEH